VSKAMVIGTDRKVQIATIRLGGSLGMFLDSGNTLPISHGY
jgi:hypothetical protein